MEFKPGDRVQVRSFEGCPTAVATLRITDNCGYVGCQFDNWGNGHGLGGRIEGDNGWWVDPTHISKYYELPEPVFSLEELTELQL